MCDDFIHNEYRYEDHLCVKTSISSANSVKKAREDTDWSKIDLIPEYVNKCASGTPVSEGETWRLREGKVVRVRQDEHGTGEVAAQRCCDSTLRYI